MKIMKRRMVTTLALLGLSGLGVQGHALSFTLFVENSGNTATTNNYVSPGASTTNNLFTNTLIQQNSGFGTGYDDTNTGGGGSVVTFGLTSTFGPSNSSGTFANAPVRFRFNLSNTDADDGSASLPAVSDSFEVLGTLSGNVGRTGTTGSSTTKITFSAINNLAPGLGDDLTSVLTINPNNGLAALLIRSEVSGQKFDIYLNQIQDISAPINQSLSISGFIKTSDVPEPGAVALMVGTGLMGGVLVRRRRK